MPLPSTTRGWEDNLRKWPQAAVKKQVKLNVLAMWRSDVGLSWVDSGFVSTLR